MRPAREPPFPHGIIEVESAGLDDSECVICNWNLAVSRPAVAGVVRGGNWARGTKPTRIREVWDAFRQTAPSVDRARGYFNPGRAVPTLEREQIRPNLRLLRRAPRGIPELLLHSEVSLSRVSRVIAFSNADADLIAAAAAPDVRLEVAAFPGYDGSTVSTHTRERLRRLLVEGHDEDQREWVYDSVRVAS
jgi:hypothetical protein